MLLNVNALTQVMSILFLGVILFLIFYVIVYVIDSINLSIIEGVGTITNKTSENMLSDENYKDTNTLTILIDDLNLYDEVVVNQTLYDSVKENQKVKISYSKGRIRNTVYIKNISID